MTYEIYTNYLGTFSINRIIGKSKISGSIIFRTKEQAQNWINNRMVKEAQ